MVLQKNLFYKFVTKYHVPKSLFITYFIAIFLILYFLIFTIFGNKGLITMFYLQEKIANKETIRQKNSNIVKAKEDLIEGMKAESLDLDLLDEQSRKILGYVGEKEIIIYKEQ